MSSVNRIGTQNIFTPQSDQVTNTENKDVALRNSIPANQYSTFETPKSSEFLDKALLLPPTLSAPSARKELFTENNVNNFIQSRVNVEDQIEISKNLQTWIKSNFRLHTAQERTVDNLTQTDLQTAETAATRATELNTKIQVKLGDTSEHSAEEQNKLQMDQINDSVYLKFSGCEQQLMQQLQMNMNRGLMR
jgi:hypothetical protein